MVDRSFSFSLGLAFLCIAVACVSSLAVMPEWTNLNKGLALLAVLVCVVNFYSECLGKFQLSYSKFAPPGDAPPRLAWALTYMLPAVVYIVAWAYCGKLSTFYHMITMTTYVGHFVKRILECLLLHKYSKKSLISTGIEVSLFYSFGAVIQHYWCNMYTDAVMGEKLGHNQTQIITGLVLFSIGELINFQHHIILANLRRDGQTAYLVPQGGLFGLLVCPHYFGELVAWLGMTVLGQHFCLYLSWLVMVVYLSGRSHHTRIWYLNKIENFPKDRYKLFPFVF